MVCSHKVVITWGNLVRLWHCFTSISHGKSHYPLVNVYSLLLKMAIEIVDLPIDSMVIFHSTKS